MKSYFIIGLFFITFSMQAQIQWQNPLPQGNVILSVCFKDAQNGFAVGSSGTIMATTDGGKNWLLKSNNMEFIFYSIIFIDQNTGLICGADRNQKGIILKTTDGGLSWKANPTIFNSALHSMDAVSQSIYSVGDGGLIIKSTDLGNSWSELDSGTQYDLWSVCFGDDNTGYIAGDYLILKTTNNGATWAALESIRYPGNLRFVCFRNADEGYFFGYGGTVLKTTDGGVTFFSGDVNPSKGSSIYSAYFTSREVGYACGLGMFKTAGAGDSWIQQSIPTGLKLFTVIFTNASEGFAAGEGGYLIHTANSGDTWSPVSSHVGGEQRLKSIFFANKDVGYAVGGTAPYGSYPEALFTKDGGNTWQEMNTHVNAPLNDVYFINENVGYAVGYQGKIIKTVDGGVTWNPVIPFAEYRNLKSVYFVNEETGYVVGGVENFMMYHQVILKTTDAGLNWIETENDRISTLNCVYFVNENIGFACGQNSNLIKTINGGETWSTSNSGIDEDLRSVYFVSNSVGYCVGEDAVIYKTTNQGDTWIQQVSGFENRLAYDLNSVYFIDANTGYAVGGNASSGFFYKCGIVLKTTNGGNEWKELDCNTWNSLYSISHVEENTFALCGDYDSILKVTDGGVTAVPDKELNSNTKGYALSQNYPNPFNPGTSINYSVPGYGFVTIKIFDVLGKEIKTVISEEQSAGNYSIKFDGSKLSNGIYFCRMQSGNFVETKKLIIIK